MMQTSVFIPDITKVNLLISRINKTCNIEDAYIVLDSANGFPNSKFKVVNKKLKYMEKYVFSDRSLLRK